MSQILRYNSERKVIFAKTHNISLENHEVCVFILPDQGRSQRLGGWGCDLRMNQMVFQDVSALNGGQIVLHLTSCKIEQFNQLWMKQLQVSHRTPSSLSDLGPLPYINSSAKS